MISLDQVRVRYGSAVALAGVTERAAPGEWLGVIGPNGAGKTTLLQAVARQVRYDGAVEVCGQPTSGMPARGWPGWSPTCRSGRCCRRT